jgi:tRNA (guanine-N7-)-methyltransferase
MAKRKQFKYAEFEKSSFHINKEIQTKGNWSKIFENKSPVILELGCGYGEYSLEMAKNNPNKNYVGIDIKGDRLWKAANEAEAENLTNIKFLRIQIEHLQNYFENKEISEIWITFPDPQPKREKRRLTNKRFLNIYKSILELDGKINLITDNLELFEYSVLEFENCGLNDYELSYDIYKSSLYNNIPQVQSRYQKAFYWRTVKFICAKNSFITF